MSILNKLGRTPMNYYIKTRKDKNIYFTGKMIFYRF